MILQRLTFAAIAVLLAAPAAHADYIVNGGFETGNFSGWTVAAGSTAVHSAGFDGYNPHSGDFFAALGNVGSNGSLSQGITDTGGQTLTLDYFLAADGGAPSYFEADWNGSLIAGSAITNSPATGYIGYSFNVLSTGADTLTFFERNDPSYWALDDVSLNVASQVPEPWSLFIVGGGLIGMAFMLRRRKTV